MRGSASLLVVLGALLGGARAVRAEQFVLLDVTFTYTKMDADTSSPSKSHYYVFADRLNPATPKNWQSPIDYRHGVVHVRTEVTDKPAGDENVRWTLCYIPYKGIAGGYGCTNSAAYTEAGVWEFEQSMTEWWQNEDIDWTQGIKEVDLVMKDGTSPTGFTNLRPDYQKFFPTTLRMTMIQVSAGDKYDPSKVPNLPPPDAGAADAPSDGGQKDAPASAEMDAAGTGGAAAGSGGVSGSGGAIAGSGGASGAGGASGSTGGAPGATTGGGNTAVSSGCTVAPNGRQPGRVVAGLSLLLALASLLVRRRR